jgi:DNA adenine methylase
MSPSSAPERAVRPPLKWAGGKRWQVPHLLPLWRPHASRRLVEPFCGGLAVALHLEPPRALLNDANPHLVNFYSAVAQGLRLDLRMENDEALFYEHRDRFNTLLSEGAAAGAAAAGLFYYLNRTGFNGLCRFNRAGEFNVPFGRYARIRYTRDFTPYQELFSTWTFTNTDVEAVPVNPDDFIYADPPYDVEFTAYAKGGFDWADQERTALWLSRHAGPVILVNQATARIETLYRSMGFAVRFLDAPRRISCNGDRRPAREIMALRNLTP